MSAGIRAGSSNDGYVQVNGNDIITALSGGNVGIGNTSPSTKLHVNGTVTATNFSGSFSGNSNISVDDWIVHTGDTDTKLGFSGADTISFHTAGAEVLKIGSSGNLELPRNNDYLKIGSGGVFSFVHNGTAAFISNSSGFLTHQCDTHQWLKGDGSAEFFRSNATGVAIGHVSPVRKFSVKSSAVNTVAIALLDNDSTNEIWRVGQASDGDGYVEVLEDGGTVGCKLDASGNSFTMGSFGVGVASPSTTLEVKGDITVYNANNQGDIFFGENGDVADSKALIRMDQLSSTAGELQFHTEGGGTLTKRVTISSTGKLTVSSDSEPQVDVQSTSAAGASMRVQSAGAYAYHMAVSTNFHWRWGMPTGTTDFVIRDSTNNRDRFWIDASNAVYLKGTNHTNFEVRSGDASTKAIIQTVQGSDVRIGSTTAHRLDLYSGGLAKVTITTSGKLNINSHADTAEYGASNYARTGTGNQGNASQAHPEGTFEFQSQTGNGTMRYKSWIQSTDPSENDMYITLANSAFYRITIKASHNSQGADVAMYLVYGLNNMSAVIQQVTSSGNFSATTQNTHVNSHDTTLKINYGSGNLNQGMRALIEVIGGF